MLLRLMSYLWNIWNEYDILMGHYRRERERRNRKILIKDVPPPAESEVSVLKLPFKYPVPSHTPISSPFGWRTHPLTGERKHHDGIDFKTPIGTPVKAMADGRVFRAGWEGDPELHPKTFEKIGFGKRIWQETAVGGLNLFLWYGHLNDIFVVDGQEIKAGDIIGKSGNTGSSSGPHLHVQARQRDTNKFYDMVFEA